MIIGFSGWRAWTDRSFITDYIDSRWAKHLVFGPLAEDILFRVCDQEGADTMIWEYLAAIGAQTREYKADWLNAIPGDPVKSRYAAGPIRNRRMILGLDNGDPQQGEPLDELIAFPQPNRSEPSARSGTWRCIKQAAYYGIPVTIPGYKQPDRDMFADFLREF